ncbi:hypothetical protein [Vibrio owensii]|uniref:hypothetical protein n=1 Tax=Vibrio harveyi group TaxID=717610 RepID=UPI003CC5FC49
MKKILLGLVVATLSGTAFAADLAEKPTGYDPAIHEFTCKYDANNYAGWTTYKGEVTHEYVLDGKTICSKTGFSEGGCNTSRFNEGSDIYKKGELMVKTDAENKHEICHKVRID